MPAMQSISQKRMDEEKKLLSFWLKKKKKKKKLKEIISPLKQTVSTDCISQIVAYY